MRNAISLSNWRTFTLTVSMNVNFAYCHAEAAKKRFSRSICSNTKTSVSLLSWNAQNALSYLLEKMKLSIVNLIVWKMGKEFFSILKPRCFVQMLTLKKTLIHSRCVLHSFMSKVWWYRLIYSFYFYVFIYFCSASAPCR